MATLSLTTGSMEVANGAFVGWNGGENETTSSKNILEEAHVVETQGLNVKSSMFMISFEEDHVAQVQVEMKVRTLAFPFGRCLSFSSPTSPNHYIYDKLSDQ